jgi:Fe-S-cluster containining protein
MMYSMRVSPPTGDHMLVQIVDSALADATRRAGDWLACRPGCTQCCIGVFAITQLDAIRLRQGLAELESSDPALSARVRKRARQSAMRLQKEFPGDQATGILDESPDGQKRFEDFANDEPCPALDRATGLCDLYAARPIACRAFGPPVRVEGGLGACELCFHGASNEQIASCEMQVDPDNLEERLLQELEQRAGIRGKTIVAYALSGS